MSTELGLALLIFVGRIGDVWSTYFITPTLTLEANPFVRRFPRSTTLVGFALCAVPYMDIGLGVMVAVASFLISASNLSRAWMAHTLGEREMEELILRVAARGSLRTALWLTWGSAAFFVLAASILWWLAQDDEIAWYFGAGLAVFGLAFAGHSTFFFVRMFRKVRVGNAA